MYHLTHSVLANTTGYCANRLSKKFHQINHPLPSHFSLQATRFLSLYSSLVSGDYDVVEGFNLRNRYISRTVSSHYFSNTKNISHLPFIYNPLSCIWSLRASELQSRNPISCLEFSLFYIGQIQPCTKNKVKPKDLFSPSAPLSWLHPSIWDAKLLQIKGGFHCILPSNRLTVNFHLAHYRIGRFRLLLTSLARKYSLFTERERWQPGGNNRKDGHGADFRRNYTAIKGVTVALSPIL